MVDANDFQKAVELINKSNNALITTHAKPDGDACGCVVAMSEILTALGKKVTPVLLSELPQWYEFLFTEKPAVLGQDVSLQQLIEGFAEPDLIILVDTNAYNQLPQFDEFLKQNDKPILVIDHHVTNNGLGTVELIDTTASAAALIIFDLLKFANWPITEKITQALFVAAATDTGWFHFSNTDSRTCYAFAELVEAGVNPTKVYHDLYQSFSPQRFKLMTAMLNTLQLHLNGRYAEQHLLQADFQRSGAKLKDTENLIDECQRISTVRVATLFVELPDGRIKCSLRSRGFVDVRKIARKFNGGGHKMAAGAHLPGSMETAKKLIKTEIEKQLTDNFLASETSSP